MPLSTRTTVVTPHQPARHNQRSVVLRASRAPSTLRVLLFGPARLHAPKRPTRRPPATRAARAAETHTSASCTPRRRCTFHPECQRTCARARRKRARRGRSVAVVVGRSRANAQTARRRARDETRAARAHLDRAAPPLDVGVADERARRELRHLAAARQRASLHVWPDARDRQMHATRSSTWRHRRGWLASAPAPPPRSGRPRTSKPERKERDRVPPPPLSPCASPAG